MGVGKVLRRQPVSEYTATNQPLPSVDARQLRSSIIRSASHSDTRYYSSHSDRSLDTHICPSAWITTSLPHDPTLPYRLHSSIFDTNVVTVPTTHPSHLQPYVYHLIVLMGNAAPPSYSDVADEKEIRQML
ncbi:hypothetical protein FRC03_009134 [Tulasnella sp. 419]|nr:hypothetical protein FRC03_009134 [Tulasnella sp. 419]